MTESFAVHLGGGLYLDASGKLSFGPPTGVQVYQAPGGFKLDTKKLQDAFKDLSGILPEDDAAKEKWMKWGVPKSVVDFLGSVAGVAGIIGTAISVYMWAIGAALALMSLMADDEGLSPEMANALYGIKNQLLGNEQIERADKMIQMHSEFDGRMDEMSTLLTRLAVEKPTGAARAAIFSSMLDIVNALSTPLSRVRNQEWATTFNPDAYKGAIFASNLLVFQRSDGTLAPVSSNLPGVTIFDYRLGVPMLLYSATTFTGLLQVAMPWFRSAGMFAAHLRKTADAIDRFVLRMQNETLSRTEYTAKMVLGQEVWPIYEMPMPLRSPSSSMGRSSLYGYAVGAFDLVSYTDAFLSKTFADNFAAGDMYAPRGLFDYHWYGSTLSMTSSLDEVAAAANEQSKQDYANLQVITGMFRLISTAAWLRYLTTPPDRSQTVIGSSAGKRIYQDEKPVVAESPYIFPSGVVKEDATLKRYKASSSVSIKTQEPGYIPAFRYRVLLRMLDSRFHKEGWREQEYVGDIWKPSYEPSVGDPRCNRLTTELDRGRILTEPEIVLYDGPSPAETFFDEKELTVLATTFDWYVPVGASLYAPFDINEVAVEMDTVKAAAASSGTGKTVLPASGGVSIHLWGNGSSGGTPIGGTPQLVPVLGKPGPLAAGVTDELDGIAALADPLEEAWIEKAERRHVKVESVTLKYQIRWTGSKLEVRLMGSPENRPFQAYVVVEESVYSGEVPPVDTEETVNLLSDRQFVETIHTPFVTEIANQLIFVPQSFFKKEKQAFEEGSKKWYDFLDKYAESQRIGPGEPVEGLLNNIREMAEQSFSTATLAAALERQVEFAREQAPELWDAIMRSADVRPEAGPVADSSQLAAE